MKQFGMVKHNLINLFEKDTLASLPIPFIEASNNVSHIQVGFIVLQFSSINMKTRTIKM